MPARALIEVDLRIAVLREKAAQGKGDAQSIAEMKELLLKRGELIKKMVDDSSTPKSHAE